MKKTLLLLLLFCACATVFSQTKPTKFSPNKPKKDKPPIELYKMISIAGDTTAVDTSLTVAKDYKYNYLRRDNFELLPFANVGQTYNSLAYSFNDFHLKPKFVAQAQHFNFMGVEDIYYYNVPTPLTEIYFKTAFNQGQQLDAFFTINTSERFNFSVAYKGLRSLGQYQNRLTSTGNFRFSSSYNTKNKRYRLRAHMTVQDILNNQNGGLTENSIELFEAGDSEFADRGRLDVNFENADNRLEGRRFFVNQEYDLISKKDSLDYTLLTLSNTLSYEEKFYQFNQDDDFEGFGDAYLASALGKKTTIQDFQAQMSATLDNSILGKISAHIGYTDYNYGYNSVVDLDEGRITNRLLGTIVEAGASYEKNYRGFNLFGKAAVNVSGDFDGNYLFGSASYALDPENLVEASIKVHSAAPNFNFLLNQSDYVNYNWQTAFNNVKTQELKFEIASKKLLDASVSYTGIDDYAFFTIEEDGITPTPQQFDGRVDYLKIKAEREFRWRRFALMNTIMYQQVLSGEEVFNVPEIITRQSLYYEDVWFKKAMFVQTGIGFKYFTSYNANAYDPVLGEFYVQNNMELGAFPLVDVFFNVKIRQTRIYLKYEHVNQLFSSTNSQFSAPGYPYRDAAIRFGFVWDFFL